MTTNYLDRLDPALIRPGRVDVKEFIGHCSDYQLRKMFEKFYPTEADGKMTEDFVKAASVIERKKLSPAAVQGHFMFFKTDPKGAIDNISRLS